MQKSESSVIPSPVGRREVRRNADVRAWRQRILGNSWDGTAENMFDAQVGLRFTGHSPNTCGHWPASSGQPLHELMREHLPSLLIRASAILRQAGHFLRHFARFADVGLVWIRTWPGISSRRPVEEREIKGCAKTPNRSGSSTAKQEILPKGDEFVQPSQRDVPNSSLITRKIGGGPKNENLIISIHIPKTGGTTFIEILRKCAEEVLYLDYGLERLAPTALFRRGKPITVPFESIISDLDSFSGRSVIHGHFHAKKYVGRFPNAVYVTWLRDPVERVASSYFYWQRTDIPGDPLWERVTAQKMSLEQFAQLEFARNLQEALLSPLAVEEFDFIGITEEYDRSLELFRRLFCPDVSFHATVRNRNPNRQGEFYDLDPELRKKIFKLNERDAHTYLDGVRRFRYLCGEVGI